MVRNPAGTYGYIGFLGFRKNQCVKCYSENAGILGILSSGAARNQFLPVQSDTFGCAENALKMLGFVRVPVGSKQRPETRPFTTKKPTVRQNVSAAVGTRE